MLAARCFSVVGRSGKGSPICGIRVANSALRCVCLEEGRRNAHLPRFECLLHQSCTASKESSICSCKKHAHVQDYLATAFPSSPHCLLY